MSGTPSRTLRNARGGAECIIPPQLRGLRFCKLRGRTKIPLERDFDKKGGYKWDDSELQEHISRGNNYGILAGYENALLIDADAEPLNSDLERRLVKTFSTRSPHHGEAGTHRIYELADGKIHTCTLYDTIEADGNRQDIGTVRGDSGQIVGPGCMIYDCPNCGAPGGDNRVVKGWYDDIECSACGYKGKGKPMYYTVESDVQIAKVTKAEILRVLHPYLKEKGQDEASNVSPKEFGKIVFTRPEFKNILDLVKAKTSLGDEGGGRYRGPPPIRHPDDKGRDDYFVVDVNNGTWFNFVSNTGGGVLELLAVMHGILKWEDCGSGALRGNDYTETLKIAKDLYGIKLQDTAKEDQKKYKAYFTRESKLYLEILIEGELYKFAYLNNEGQVVLTDSVDNILPVKLPRTKQGDLAFIVKMPNEGILTARLLSPPELLEKIKAHIKKYVDLSDLDIELASYYVLFSWVYRKTNTVGYLRFISDTGKGKSRMLTVVSDLCFYPISAAGSGSFSGMIRTKESWHGTLVMDEADIRGEKEHQVIKYLNLGFEAGKFFILSDKKNPRIQDVFDPFGPKILAMREPFRDNATEGRLLSISPYETTDDNIPPILLAKYDEETTALRNEIARFVMTHWDDIDGECMLSFIGMGIERRLQQLAMPLSIIFQLWNEGKGKFREYVSRRQRELKRERSLSWHGSMFNLVYAIATGDEDLIEEDQGKWASFYSSGEEIQAVTPSMIAKYMNTNTKKATETLRSIGFEVELRYITVIVCGKGDKPTEKQKRVRAYVVPNEKVWQEIIQRYYYDESDAKNGTDRTRDSIEIPVTLKSKTYTRYPHSVRQPVPSVPSVPQDGDGSAYGTERTNGTGDQTPGEASNNIAEESNTVPSTPSFKYHCECGAGFNDNQSYANHILNCRIHQAKVALDIMDHAKGGAAV